MDPKEWGGVGKEGEDSGVTHAHTVRIHNYNNTTDTLSFATTTNSRLLHPHHSPLSHLFTYYTVDVLNIGHLKINNYFFCAGDTKLEKYCHRKHN